MPCTRTGSLRVSNQCAVRMSVALSRNMGTDVLGAFRRGGVHGPRCCAGTGAEKVRHITSAENLFTYLRRTLNFPFVRISGANDTNSRPGIIYFENCFHRSRDRRRGITEKRGDHIDYWNGSAYFNAVTGNNAAPADLDLFDRASAVWFYRV